MRKWDFPKQTPDWIPQAETLVGGAHPTMRHLGEVMTVQNEPSAKTHGVILTEAAAAKAKSLLDQEGRDDLALRIAVQLGCAGLRYNLSSTTGRWMVTKPRSSVVSG